MNSKNNRVNHDFQIVHFLAGSCHTADGAYSLLCDQREDRETALALVKATSLRNDAKRARAALTIAASQPGSPEHLEALADLAELDAYAATTARNVAACEAELATLHKCIEALQPHRLYKHLTDPEAHEAAQCEEWRLELIHRAENQLLTTGTIAYDQLATMRQHPAFEKSILPALEDLRSNPANLAARLVRNKPDYLKLLELS